MREAHFATDAPCDFCYVRPTAPAVNARRITVGDGYDDRTVSCLDLVTCLYRTDRMQRWGPFKAWNGGFPWRGVSR